MSELRLYLPDFIQEAMDKVTAPEQPEFDLYYDELRSVEANQSLDTLDEDGASAWEKILKINTLASDTLANRRFRIKARLFEQLPYTHNKLTETLEGLCGKDKYWVEYEGYTIIVRVALESRNNYSSVDSYLKRVLPANLAVDLSLMFNQHWHLAQHRHSDLADYTYYQLRNRRELR